MNKKAFERSVILWLILALLGVIAIALLNLGAKDAILTNLDKLSFT